MAFNPHHPVLTAAALLLLISTVVAQPSPPSNNYGFAAANFNSSTAVVIVVLVSAFFFLAFFSIYIRQCSLRRGSGAGVVGGRVARVFVDGGRQSRRRGLEPEVLETFPTFAYSEVRELKFGKEALECAVCLSEFTDDEALRLLPACNHVFHVDCIDVWLGSHVTCPVCRTDLAAAAANSSAEDKEETTPAPAPAPDHVAISVAGEGAGPPEIMERTGSLKEETAALWSGMFGRSHTTGHSVAAAMASGGGGGDRYTLRLPEHVRREIMEAGRLRRASSCVGFAGGGEASARRGYRTGGRSERWAAKTTSFARALSMRVPAWAAGRRGDGEGSRKKGEAAASAAAAEGSGKRVFPAAVKGPFDCLGGGGGEGATTDDEESSIVAFARV